MIPILEFYYINHRGDVASREVINPVMRFGTALPWYPEEQWFIEGWDVGKEADRTFAVKNILGFIKE